MKQTGGDIVLCAGSRRYLLRRRRVEKKGSRVKKKGWRVKVTGRRVKIKRFWKGGKQRFQRVGEKGILRVKKKGCEGGKKRMVKKALFKGEKKGSPKRPAALATNISKTSHSVQKQGSKPATHRQPKGINKLSYCVESKTSKNSQTKANRPRANQALQQNFTTTPPKKSKARRNEGLSPPEK